MIAIGYTMVYGIIGMINFAHGDIFMLGGDIHRGHPGCTCSLTDDDRRHVDGRSLELDDRQGGLPAIARFVPPGAADHGDRHVDRVVKLHPGDAGSAQQADPALVSSVYDIFGITISLKQIIIITAILLSILWYIVNRTSLGRAQRATEQDRKMAALPRGRPGSAKR